MKTYEVTEKFIEPAVYQMAPKISLPIGFSKPSVRTFIHDFIFLIF